jgi:hypothetical protein
LKILSHTPITEGDEIHNVGSEVVLESETVLAQRKMSLLLDGGMTSSGASHRYSAIEDQTLCLVIVSLTEVNFSSRALYIGVGDVVHCPLIMELPPIKT